MGDNLVRCFLCPKKPATLNSNNSKKCEGCNARYHPACADRIVDKSRPGCFLACCGEKKSKRTTEAKQASDDEDDFNKLDDNLKPLYSLLNKRLSNLDTKLDNVTKNLSDIDLKVIDLEDRIEVLEENTSHNIEFIISEMQDRHSRECNLIIYNLNDAKDASKTDSQRLQNLFERCSEALPFDIKDIMSQRLGKNFIKGKQRPLKVTLPKRDDVHWIYSQKKNIVGDSNISISGDLTKQQRNYRVSVIKEIKKRSSEGEGNLLIKYVRGVPTIMKNKSTQHSSASAASE